MAHNIVTSIAQTPDGALWFGTFDGISRYDGRNWQTFGCGEGLPGNLVWDLEAQPNGVVWAAIGGGFVGDIKQAAARFENGTWVGMDTPEMLFGRFGLRRFFAPSPNRGSLITDDGRLLLLSEGALQLVRGEDGEIMTGAQSVLYTADGQTWVAYGTGQRSLFRFGALGGGGTLRGAADQGIASVDVASSTWRRLSRFDAVMREPVLEMAQAPDGTIWFGTDGDGLWSYGNEVWTRFTVEDGLPSDRIHVVKPIGDDSVWIGTPAGVAYLRADGSWQVYTERDGLPNNYIEDIKLASDGAVWVATRGGVGRFGSAGWTHHLNWPGKKDRGATELVRDASGSMWAGTREGIYGYKDGRWQIVASLHDRARGRFIDFAVDGKDVLWAATSSQILRWQGQEWELFETGLEASSGGVRAIAASHQGGVWVAHRSGVFRFDKERVDSMDDFQLPQSIYEATDGSVWIGDVNGLIHVDGGQRKLFAVADGLPEGPINSVVADGTGSLWVSTPFDGVAVFDPETETWKRVPGNMVGHFNGVRRIYPADDGTV
ncbi:MAG: hypothetical protein O3B73_01105 [bacterium]|nr:hypothetical protein [bacterium]